MEQVLKSMVAGISKPIVSAYMHIAAITFSYTNVIQRQLLTHGHITRLFA